MRFLHLAKKHSFTPDLLDKFLKPSQLFQYISMFSIKGSRYTWHTCRYFSQATVVHRKNALGILIMYPQIPHMTACMLSVFYDVAYPRIHGIYSCSSKQN